MESMMTMEPIAKIVTSPDTLPEQADSHTDTPLDQAEPPTVYLAACGALCDIFWWARRTPEPPK
jgi:hypothetical protein